MRRAAHVDSTQAEIVEAQRAVGATVAITASMGDGFPDLVVGFRGQTFLQEVKSGDGELNQLQERWHRNWRGRPVDVVRTPEEALRAIGALR